MLAIRLNLISEYFEFPKFTADCQDKSIVSLFFPSVSGYWIPQGVAKTLLGFLKGREAFKVTVV